jgi:type I restriction enzyme R subunit
VDARNVRNIVLMRPITSMVEFKQIIGRGTRLFEGKDHFTIYDFVQAHRHFNDPEWDGEPQEPEAVEARAANELMRRDRRAQDGGNRDEEEQRQEKVVIKLADGKERQIQFMTATNFFSPDGKLLSAAQFIQSLYDTLKLPEFFKSEEHLRALWSDPTTRSALLDRLAGAGFGRDELTSIQSLINAHDSDLFDVLQYIAYARPPVTRSDRVAASRSRIYERLEGNQREFVDFVLAQYVNVGVDELQQERLPHLIAIKYHSQMEGIEALGGTEKARATFIGFQRDLYSRRAQP